MRDPLLAGVASGTDSRTFASFRCGHGNHRRNSDRSSHLHSATVVLSEDDFPGSDLLPGNGAHPEPRHSGVHRRSGTAVPQRLRIDWTTFLDWDPAKSSSDFELDRRMLFVLQLSVPPVLSVFVQWLHIVGGSHHIWNRGHSHFYVLQHFRRQGHRYAVLGILCRKYHIG